MIDISLGLIKESFLSHGPFIPIARILSTAYSFISCSDQPDSVVLIRPRRSIRTSSPPPIRNVLKSCSSRSVWSLSMASYVYHSWGAQRTRQRSLSSMKLVIQTESAPRSNSRKTGGIINRPLSSLIRSATKVAGESGFPTVELRLAACGHAGNFNRRI